MFGAGLFADSASQTVELGSKRVKLRITCCAKGSDDLFVGSTLDRSRPKYARLASCGRDFLLQALEVLVRLFIRWKNVYGILNRNGAKLLQFAPDANAEVGWSGWQLMNQQYPFMRRCLLCLRFLKHKTYSNECYIFRQVINQKPHGLFQGLRK